MRAFLSYEPPSMACAAVAVCLAAAGLALGSPSVASANIVTPPASSTTAQEEPNLKALSGGSTFELHGRHDDVVTLRRLLEHAGHPPRPSREPQLYDLD